MLFYVFALLLVYTDGRGIERPEKNTILGNSIIELANRCGSKLLVDESVKVAKECNLVIPPYEEKQLKCLMFYDINNQLCHEKPPIPVTDYNAIMNEKINITSFCAMAAKWNIQNIPDYPEYKNKLDIILKDPFECYTICSNEDVLSKDMNFYCKYFKWGMELLHPVTVSNSDTGASLSGADSIKPPVVTTNVAKEVSSVAAANEEPIKKTSPQDNASKDIEVPAPLGQESSSALNAPNPLVEEQAPSKNPAKPAEDEKPVLQPSVKIEPMPTSNDEASKVQNNEEKPPEKKEEHKKIGDEQDSVLNKPKPANSDPDYESELDEEEGKEGLADLNGDDADDAMIGESKPLLAQDKPAKIAVSILHPEDSEKSIFPNMGDGFSEEDDHFFPFFLTVIILVVLLYVLYHNKSKVTKVVLGLIVEGRQSGRGRRGSRGHAYRRLDTLEQAMGASSAAPPAKIIY